MSWGRVILFTLGVFLGVHLTRFLFGLGYELWITFMSPDGIAVARAILAGIVVFLLFVRLALAERQRVIAHFIAVLVFSSALEWIWLNYVAPAGRAWIFGFVETLIVAVMAYFVSLLVAKNDNARRR